MYASLEIFLQNFVSLSTIYLVVKFLEVLTNSKRARPLNIKSDLEPAQVKVIRQGQKLNIEQMRIVVTNYSKMFHGAFSNRILSGTCSVMRKEMKEMKGTLWRNFKTNSTIRFLDPINPILETEIIFLIALDQKL